MMEHLEYNMLSILILLILKDLLNRNLVARHPINPKINNPKGALACNPLKLVLAPINRLSILILLKLPPILLLFEFLFFELESLLLLVGGLIV